MNVGFLRWITRDVDPETEVSLKINVGNLTETGEIYAYATDVDFSDVDVNNILYIEANEY